MGTSVSVAKYINAPITDENRLAPSRITSYNVCYTKLLRARNYWKSHNFAKLGNDVFDTIVEYAGQLPTPQCEIFIGLLGGRAGRVKPDATAYSHRDAQFVLNMHARWDT